MSQTIALYSVLRWIKLLFLPSVIVYLGLALYGVVYMKLRTNTCPVSRYASEAQKPAAMPSQTIPKPIAPKTTSYLVEASLLNVRKTPNAYAQIVKRLPHASQVQVLEIQDGWARLESGWVMLDFLRRL
ncbi:SH3 domain-containing protein [Helicobacter pametensis]|uniref:SH3 domain-containing protein n=1 Tax=Helicobacter pametensis TaxID=95149 RepID=UPI0004892962|nr:SH3 domain-containing protein [Helicobacter pametensis]